MFILSILDQIITPIEHMQCIILSLSLKLRMLSMQQLPQINTTIDLKLFQERLYLNSHYQMTTKLALSKLKNESMVII